MTEQEFVNGTNHTLRDLDIDFSVTDLKTSLDLMSSMILANKLKAEQIIYYDDTAKRLFEALKLFHSKSLDEADEIFKIAAEVIIDESKYPEFVRGIYNKFVQKMRAKETHTVMFEKLARKIEACKNYERKHYDKLREEGAEITEVVTKRYDI